MAEERKETSLKDLFIACLPKCHDEAVVHPFLVVREALTSTKVPDSWLQGRNPLINLNYLLRDVNIDGRVIDRSMEPLAGSQFLPLFHDFVPTADADSDNDDQLI